MKKGISLIVLVITIVIIIILSATVILTISNTGVINNAKIAALASDQNNLQTSIELYFTDVVTENLHFELKKEKVLFGYYGDGFRIVEKNSDELVPVSIEKNGNQIEVYKLDKDICEAKEIEIPKTPSNNCDWYISLSGQVYLVYNEDAVIPEWIIGNPPEGKQIESDVLDEFVAKIGEWEKEPNIYDIIPVADANMFKYTGAINGTVQIDGFNPEYTGNIPTEIKFPTIDPNGNTIIGINSSAFKGNTNITKIVIPEGVAQIGNNAFDSCMSLNEVYIPTTLTSTHYDASSPFNNCDKIEKITIPNYIASNEGYKVSSLFANSKTTINTVNFVGEITTITRESFNGFTALESINIPDTVTSIGIYAFKDCTSLSGKLSIPENVTTIGTSAFYNCSKITDVEFLSNGALKTIQASSFKGLSLITKVIIPEGVTSLGNNAFDSCISLKEVYIPTTLTSTFKEGSSPFNKCDKIEKISIPDYVAKTVNYTPYDVFGDSKSTIKEVDFVGEITAIGANAFNGFTALESIIIPDAVTSIGNFAFKDCTSLSGKLSIPENVTTIGTSAFYNCSNISQIEFLSQSKLKTISAWAFANLKLIESVNIPEGVTTLGNNAFDSCISLKEVYIPTTLTSTFNGVSSPFNNCDKIEKITIPNYIASNEGYKVSSLFANSKTTINTVNFVGEITTITKESFNGFTALESINIPDTVTSIGMYAFKDCTSLSGKLSIPENVTTIGASAFYNCSNISQIEFLSQSKLKTISAWAFANLKLIESVNIPSSVTTMQNDIFNGCTNLKTINYSGTATGSPWGAPNATVVAQ